MENNIIISNKKSFEEKKEYFKKQGIDKMHIISDFDRTLTKAIVDNQKSSTSWAQFRNQGYFDDDYFKRSHDMFNHYRPIEISNTLSLKEKTAKMTEWWEKHLQLLIEKGVDQDILKEIVKNGKIRLRNKSLEFFNLLNKNNIPLIIISSGLGDLVTQVLKDQGVYSKNLFIISNFFEFKNNKAIGFKDQIINSLNKHESEIKNLPIYSELLKRKNVIVLGDSIDDLGMIEGFPYENIIKIGFLNDGIDKHIDEFKKNFDVVILNDGNMDFINDMLYDIIS